MVATSHGIVEPRVSAKTMDNISLDIGACFRCNQPAQFAWFFDDSVGHFLIGSEPRLCKSCDLQLRALPIAQRRAVLVGFEVSSTPRAHANPVEDIRAREREFKRRGRT